MGTKPCSLAGCCFGFGDVLELGIDCQCRLTFNLLNQSKILFTAFMLYVMMGRGQSLMQCIGLFGLFAASSILSTGKAASSSEPGDEKSLQFYEGIVPCLAASVLSGLASALSQIALQVRPP
eukprot:m.97394 g.97394  ORF g.97394 m.97394 type:complete len:122 (-) comp12398_c0_seq1:64-429(-)